MASESRKRKSKTRIRSGFDLGPAEGVPAVVSALPESADLRGILRPARSLAGNPAHYARLDGAMDAAFAGGIMPRVEQSVLSSLVTFVGYPVLQQLSQDALIRLCIQTRTDEMLRAWIDIRCDDPARKERIEDHIARIGLKDTLSKALTTMGLMGGAFLFIDTGNDHPEQVLNKTDTSAEFASRRVAFRVVDPIFTTPQSFNASNPLAEDFYRPSVFYVMGTAVHASRLIRFVENEVPDLLKPSYNFFGIAQAQLLADYVTHFRRNREEVNQLLRKFSTSFIKTDLKAQLFNNRAWNTVTDRVRFFAKYRENSGVGLLDKETEDFVQVNTPLGGLTDIVRQSLEFVVSVNQSGVVKTLGYTPNGFSSGESDVKLQADLIATRQEKILRRPLETILRILQLELFGNIDPSLTFDFNPIDEDDERADAEVQKLRADAAAVYLDRGVMTEDEVRESLRIDDDAPFGELPGEAPGAPEADFAQMLDPTVTGEAYGTPNQPRKPAGY